MNLNLITAFSLSIGIAGVMGLIRLNKVDSTYYPFICLLWVGFLNELVSNLLVRSGKSNAVTGNLYLVLEGTLIVYQFKKWDLFRNIPGLYYAITFGFFALWLVEIFVLNTIYSFASYFIIARSFVIALLSIALINYLVATSKGNLFKNCSFIICVCFLIYYSCAALVESFYLYGLTGSISFQDNIQTILYFINLVTNLLYALAVLWMPKKYGFSI